MGWITRETHAGETVQAGTRQLTPLSRGLRLQIPGWSGGVIWNRPAAVLATEADGQETLVQVRDYTRQAELLLVGAGLLGSLIIWLTLRSRKA